MVFTACFADPHLKIGRQWFDCVECHHEQRPDHELQKANELVSHQEESPNSTTNSQMQTLACKKCKKVFRKDPKDFEERFAGYYVCHLCELITIAMNIVLIATTTMSLKQ